MTGPTNDQQGFHQGDILDKRFEIVRRLGAGSFGAVYETKQLVFDQPMRRVALKLFHSDKVKRDNAHEVFSDAVELIGLYEHEPSPEVLKALTQVYDIGMVETIQRPPALLTQPLPQPQAYVCMKLIPGGRTLEQPIHRFSHGGMPVGLALNYLRQLLVPLAWMHTEGERVHGDLKPDNVLLSERDEVVLTDFGLAAHILFGSFGGAIQYQAPESLVSLPGQATAQANTAADVYGVGLIWYQMLTGRHPFEQAGLEVTAAGGDQAQLVRAHREVRKWPFRRAEPGERGDQPGRIVPPSEINEEMGQHPQLEALLQSCLAYRQVERPGNARTLLRQIDEYLQAGKIDGLSIPTEPEKPSPVTSPATRTPDALLADADAHIAARRFQEALRLVDSVLGQCSPQNRPLRVKTLCTKARALKVTGRFEEAVKACQEAQDLAQDDPLIYETLAIVYEKENDTVAAAMRRRASEVRQSKRRR